MSLQPYSKPDVALVVSGVVCGARRTAFWAAVALPFLHVPLLYADNQHPEAVLALIVINVACLLAGHRHPGTSHR